MLYHFYIPLGTTYRLIIAIGLFLCAIAFFLLFGVIEGIIDRIKKKLDKYIILRSVYELYCPCKNEVKNQEDIQKKVVDTIKKFTKETVSKMSNIIDRYLKSVGYIYNILNQFIIAITIFIVNSLFGFILIIKPFIEILIFFIRAKSNSEIKVEVEDC